RANEQKEVTAPPAKERGYFYQFGTDRLSGSSSCVCIIAYYRLFVKSAYSIIARRFLSEAAGVSCCYRMIIVS
ncbi:MAG: hypothetical protein II735_01050, partial [Clostridia bacterium]|nr:hypothetical protein [Clostridia bacterium]